MHWRRTERRRQRATGVHRRKAPAVRLMPRPAQRSRSFSLSVVRAVSVRALEKECEGRAREARRYHRRAADVRPNGERCGDGTPVRARRYLRICAVSALPTVIGIRRGVLDPLAVVMRDGRRFKQEVTNEHHYLTPCARSSAPVHQDKNARLVAPARFASVELPTTAPREHLRLAAMSAASFPPSLPTPRT